MEPMNHKLNLQTVHDLLNSEGIIVIIGAGVSVDAGIPSFRGSGSLGEIFEGAGRSIREIMSSQIRGGGVLREEHCKLISTLATKAITAKPTLFHRMLQLLDADNKVIRIYTQNIDGLESKAGFDLLDRSQTSRCVALHGTLVDLRCSTCSAIKPLENAFQKLNSGTLPICLNTERALATLRKRMGPCGTFYPDIVLYNDPVKDEDYIKDVVNQDVRKVSKNTALLVVGTSLKIPGIVQIIRAFGNAIASKGGQTLYIDVDPNIPDTLRSCFQTIVEMDCQIFAKEVVAALKPIGVEAKEADADLRKDMRPLWDWDWV